MQQARLVGGVDHAVAHAGGSIYLVEWHGHVTAADVRRVCAAIDAEVPAHDEYLLLVDATGITGFEPDARAVGAAWSRGYTAARARLVAVVTDSQLAAAESPAAALAPRARARLFGSRAAALRYLEARDSRASGTFVRDTGARVLPEFGR